MDLAAHRRHYRQNHRTIGCKLTHMFGVPLIVASLVTLFFAWKLALGMFVFGWALQLAGHFLFEKNNPVLFANPGNPLTYFYAVIFVAEEWWQVITLRGLQEEPAEDD